MKKIFILIAASIMTLGASAQQVPNGGFENWNDSINPIGWNTLANLFGAQYSYFAVKDTSAQAHVAGSVTLKMTTSAVNGQGTLRSYVGLGTIGGAGTPTFTGAAYTKRPDTLYMAYAYFSGNGPTGADTGQVLINLTQAGTSLFGGTQTFLLPPSNGGFLAFPLTGLYTLPGAPDTLSIVFKSGKSASGTELGSTLYLDEVHFDASVDAATGINDVNPSAMVSTYPNPANNTINVAVHNEEIGSMVQLTDLGGRTVYTGTLSGATTAINVSTLPAGIYAINIRSNDHLTIYKGKISVAH